MVYTCEHYALLETFEKGRLVQELNEDELYTYRFFMQNGLLQPRADLEDGLHYLSEKGKYELAAYRAEQQEIQKQADSLAQQEAKEKKEKASNRLHDLLMILIGAVITYILEHLDEVVLWIAKHFP